MSDIENSGNDDDSVTVAKKNGTLALKENNVTKNVAKSNDDKTDVDIDDHDSTDKLNGSASPKKVHSVMNGGGNGVSDAEGSVTNGKWTDDGETSHPVTDDDSVLEATPTPSSRSSPRKVLNDEYRSVACHVGKKIGLRY